MAYLAVLDVAATDEDTIVAIDVLANDDFHMWGAAITAVSLRDGSLGTVTVSDNRILFDPNAYDYLGAGETATVLIDYTGQGIGPGSHDNFGSAVLTIVVTGTTRALSWALTPLNDVFAAPTADLWTVMGMAGSDDLTGGVFADHIDGEDGDDILRGAAGDDRLFGGAGADRLSGQSGSDELHGGLGNDIYLVEDDADLVVEGAGEGVDSVTASISYTLTANVEDLTLAGHAPLDGYGNELANRISGNIAANRLEGAGGDDVLGGGKGDDVLVGGDGADILIGGLGVDIMEGGAGNDRYEVRTVGDQVIEAVDGGHDLVRSFIDHVMADNVEELLLVGNAREGIGNGGANFMFGTMAANLLEGRDGNDVLRGVSGADTLRGGNGEDLLYGGFGDDLLQGDDGNDRLNGELGGDTIEGGAGRDQLYGRDGGDKLAGGDGDDIIVGGLHRDQLSGGAGADQFAFGGGESSHSWATADRITDFNRAEGDRINLKLADADTATAADDAFRFIGEGAFSGAAGELRTQAIRGDTYIFADTNGDTHADFCVRIDGSVSLVATDFVL
jgi:Ca2+-binding RTX toxin-like protein